MKKLAKVLSLSLALAMCAICLTACAATAESVTKKYEDAGYQAYAATTTTFNTFGVDEGAVEWAVYATKNLVKDNVLVACFKDKEEAKKMNEVLQKRFKTKLSGKVLYIATTEDALNAK